MAQRYQQERYRNEEDSPGTAPTKHLATSLPTHIVGPMVILKKNRDSTNMDRVAHALRLPFNPNLTKTLLHLDSFTDLSVQDLRHCVRGLIINVDNTLIEPGGQEFSPEIIAKLKEIQRSLRVCFYSNDNDHRPQLDKTGIPFARNIASKPDPNGFEMAARLKLDLKAEDCGVAGSDYTLDGACREAGMRYIHVKPISGSNEPFSEKLVRGYGNMVAKIHDKFRQK
jgi:predicted HAD superfamily phosphohydrolase YqeG